jgi:molecular chaperone DnaK
MLRRTPAYARFESTDEKVKGSVIGIDLGKSPSPAVKA